MPLDVNRRRVVGAALLIVGLVAAFVAGQHYPTHRARHYQKFGDTRYLYDPQIGKLCSPLPPRPKPPEPVDLSGGLAPIAPPRLAAQYPIGSPQKQEVKTSAELIPSCGTE